MQNPNASIALVASQAAIAIQQAVAHFLDVRVGTFWSAQVVSISVAVVLYVGRHGLRDAIDKTRGKLVALWRGPKLPEYHGW